MATKKRTPTPQRRTPPRPTKSPRADRRLVVALVALAGIAILAVMSASGGNGDGGPVAEGVLRSSPPWAPQYDGLQSRVAAAGFPAVGDESYHVHALLSVFREGEQVVVPANIGIDQQRQFISPLHTHTPDGVIHFEADDPAPFNLGQVFDVWGVAFDADRLGDRTNAGNKTVQVYVNGELVAEPRARELRDGDNIVVAYGSPGSFPTEPPTDALDNT